MRYGGEPDEPDELVSGGPSTRSELIHYWIGFSDSLHGLAEIENGLAQLKARAGTSAEREAQVLEVEAQVETQFGPLRDAIRRMAEAIAKLRSAPSEGMVE
jgi:hypothetical protein